MKIFALALALIGAAACAPVPHWERESLASARMRLDPDAAESSLVLARVKTREEGHVGSPGSSSTGAGGCGCN